MATLLTLQDSMNFVAPYLKNQPLQVSNQQPALTAGNVVLGSILGPPCRWRFNRREITFNVTSAATDYVQALSTFGYLEAAWLIDSQNIQYPLKGAICLGRNTASGTPEAIAPQFDDNAGNITFRLDKTPEKNYSAYLDFQNKAPLLTSPAASWGSVPDEFQYIYNYGFLAIMCLLVNDSRFPIFENYFIGRLLGAQDGLDAQEKDIFLSNWANRVSTLKRADGVVSGGVAGRGR